MCIRDRKELASLAIHQHDSANGYQEVYDGEKNVTPMSLNIGEDVYKRQAMVLVWLDPTGRIRSQFGEFLADFFQSI